MGWEQESEKIRQCWEQEAAFCQDACPFHLDVRDFMRRLARGGFNGAFRAYANAVGFPALVAALCPGYCQAVCPRAHTDAALDIPGLEQAALRWAARTEPDRYNMPDKPGRFAIVGGGGSGLACALRLCNKKYQVTLYEREPVLGGSLLSQLAPELVTAEIERQFQYERCDWRLRQAVPDLAALLELARDYDGVYVAAGAGSFPALLPSTVPPAPWLAQGLLVGGEMGGCDSVTAIAQGLQAALLLESGYKTGCLRGAAAHRASRIRLDPGALSPQPPAPPLATGYDREAAQAEARRCLLCRCDACRRHCPLLGYFEKYPKRVRDEVQVTIHPGTLDGNGTVATRLISTCSQCGLCGEVCPQHIDLGAFFRLSHQAMLEKQAMPWAFHEFYLRDLAHARGERAALWAAPTERPGYVFFPGCQLGAMEPDTVRGLYRLLRTYAPDCAIALDCCGAPAVWAGDRPEQERIFAELRERWLAWGRPVLLLACPSCLALLGEYLPELPTLLVSEFLVEQGFVPPPHQGELAVFDPCALRHYPNARQSLRTLAQAAGLTLAQLSEQGETAQCCAWGGQIALTNPPYHQWLAEQRAAADSRPYLVACINCQAELQAAGKDCVHIFQLLLGGEGQAVTTTAWDWQQRRDNREALKQALLREFFPALPCPAPSAPPGFRLTPAAREKLARERILQEDVQAVLDAYGSSGHGVRDCDSGHLYAHAPAGSATTWLEFSAQPEGKWLVHNAYQHRLALEDGPLDVAAAPVCADSPLRCTACDQPLTPGQVFFSYLTHSFHTTLPRCPRCGQVYIDEALVKGRMAQVEMELEDK